MGRVGAYLTQSGLAIEDVRAYVIEGLRVIASNQMNIPKEEVVMTIGRWQRSPDQSWQRALSQPRLCRNAKTDYDVPRAF